MKKFVFFFLFGIMLATLAMGASFQIDPVHSQVHFKVTHLMMFSVRGVFNDFSGTIEADPAKKTIKAVKGKVDSKSVSTRDKDRDKHLKSKDFFWVSKYPSIAFTSTRVTGSGNSITVIGNLTIRGVTQEIVLTGKFVGSRKDPWGNSRAGFEANGVINRKDFGLIWNQALEAGGVLVGNDVTISLEVAAVHK